LERADVHHREVVGSKGIANVYWRFVDTYDYQSSEEVFVGSDDWRRA
jgi:hypothetical protein